MSRITSEEVLKALNGAETGKWMLLSGIIEGVGKNLGEKLNVPFLYDRFVELINAEVSYGHAISETTSGGCVRYQITPLGQNWLTKHT